MSLHRRKVDEFLREASQFRLGELPTESSHPLTTELSRIAVSDVKKAIGIFQEVEILALEKLLEFVPQIDELALSMQLCIQNSGRIFFCGCGATGRLSISLETNWRESLSKKDHSLSESVVGFIAGGDYALVKSIENFEDHSEYGKRQLLELGFTKDDLLISCTEGGETPFVIGATLFATEISKYNVHFLFCNPKESLKHIERSQAVFRNTRVQSWSLDAGPQAICGSTRLQASSILYLACGSALFAAQSKILNQKREPTHEQIKNYLNFLRNSDLQTLQNLIAIETNAYVTNEFITYHAPKEAMPILTDLTERSPTFNLLSVENSIENSSAPATANLCVQMTVAPHEAWQEILRRPPRALDWLELNERFNEKTMLGFDFSDSKNNLRQKLIGTRPQKNIFLYFENNTVRFDCNAKTLCTLSIPKSILERNLFLKLIFNLVSSLTQCQNGRVLGNIMIFVKPSNKKLIDRAARFAKIILHNEYQLESVYDEIIDCVFQASETLKAEESVVLNSVQIFLDRHK